MAPLTTKRPRDEKGRFAPSSELEEKIVSARLHKGYRQELIAIAESKNISTAELVRLILEDYIDQFSP